MKKIMDIIISMKTMLIFTLIFALSSAVATFIENDFGTQTAWAVVYGTKWFEFIMVILALNLIGNIFRFKLYKKDKLPALIFHAGFLVILLGSFLTRYIGYEGIMHIREGAFSNHITSTNNYINIDATKGDKEYHTQKKILLSKITPNSFDLTLDIDGKKASFILKDYLPNANQKIIEDKNGKAIIKMMVAGASGPQTLILRDGEIKNASGLKISLNNPKKSDISIYTKDGKFFFKSTKPINWIKMADNSNGEFEAGKEYPFESGRLLDINNIKVVPRELFLNATVKLVNAVDKTSAGKKMKEAQKEALIADLNYNGKSKSIALFGFGRGTKGIPVEFILDGVKFKLRWGTKDIEIPFSIQLRDFQLERYPGSMSPASYASEVTLIDQEKKLEKPYRIYMNHVLDYRNYRFFQSSYDTDEKGTVLSVNHDPGKNPTYIGYLLLTIGFILSLLNPKSRFRKLATAVKKDTMMGSFILFLFASMFINQPLFANDASNVIKSYKKEHAQKFSDLLIQSVDGRIKTIDTFANEVMLKLHKSTDIDGLDANQVMLGMLTSPQAWQDVPFIKVKHTKLRKILGIKDGEKYASFNDFFLNKTQYKLVSEIQNSVRKPPIKRNEYDRSLIKTDEKLNIMYMIFTGDLLKLIPKVNDENHKWYSVKEAIGTFPTDEANGVRKLFIDYFSSIDEAVKSGDWSKADEGLKALQDYQYKISSDIIPDRGRLNAEKLFKRWGVTNKLIIVYITIGLILLIFVMINMVKQDKTKYSKLVKFTQSLFVLAFLIHTAILAARWYIGGHAPWSNAYEAMLYVAWSMALAGLVFMKYSPMVPALTSIIAGSTLATTFFNEMNPQITNLVPVLKSYWLNIHVSMITASYGFLGLSMILGLFTLVLFLMRNKNNPNIDKSIIEATRINEMTTIVGLMMLTIGNFLGGVWANESWGRYWSWDPKETWAWISILVYVAVTHIRFVPYFKKHYEYKYAVTSVLAFSSIVMTFVGVNYYLSGMHSYAAGEPVPVPKYLYVIIALVFALIFAASLKIKDRVGK
ncbi:MAG: cytochrome c biogenesis protein CcsA [Epsilonproteobacteria bacterium]|nr:cytochrome c biogenesis protein CcsA [Campylobacterota bacterium]